MDYRDEYAADAGFLGEDEADLWIDEEMIRLAEAEREEDRDWDLEVDGYLEREAEERDYR